MDKVLRSSVMWVAVPDEYNSIQRNNALFGEGGRYWGLIWDQRFLHQFEDNLIWSDQRLIWVSENNFIQRNRSSSLGIFKAGRSG